jgi:hypothetical protein
MASLSALTTTNLGFLTILREGTGFLGGYLVTNLWGRPMEFRLSSAVQPNRIQQILYGQSLENYISADLIAKTLVEKSTCPAQILLTDNQAVLDLRLSLDLPVALVNVTDPAQPLVPHAHFAGDANALRKLLDTIGNFDFAEPFNRIREAVSEARKLGVSGRNGSLAS